MKSGISLFNRTIFFKNVTRYFPAWLVYSILGLLITQTGVFGSGGNYNASNSLANSTGFMGFVQFVYCGVVASLVFGDLCRSRMCNALHALPIRRETWFFAHILSALALCIVPNLGLALLMWLQLGGLWYTAFLWLAMTSILSVCFLGLAVFSMLCVGRRFAAWVVYVMLNFGILVVRWVVSALIVPKLYGVPIGEELFYGLCPVVHLFSLEELWTVEHLHSCNCYRGEYGFSSGYHDAAWVGLGNWNYLWILLAVGIAFLAGALVLYRRRHMERAGDFVTVRPMKIILPLVCAVFTGMIFSLFGGFFLLILGMPVGFFLCRMLVERKGNVFGGKNWMRLGILMSAFLLFVGLGRADILGIEKRIPDVDRVERVLISESLVNSYELEMYEEEWAEEKQTAVPQAELLGVDPNYRPGKQGTLILSSPAQIQKILDIHDMMLREGNGLEQDVPFQIVTIHYWLTDGSTLTRHYYVPQAGQALRALREFTNTPEYILGVSSPEELLQDLEGMILEDYGEVVDARWRAVIAEALFKDAEAGNLNQDMYDMESRYIHLEYRYEDGRYGYLNVRYSERATHTREAIERYKQYKAAQSTQKT